ncbi:MAG: PQQ-dependent sugar dehydrogenase [Flavobacteriales bacterium]|nr:PQQ-dependent sugar dehydrogenase [Flavobacteriales bacterium]MCL4281331.1 PQQ-dependent sugar dehydrogenase [Flavobacteriales bacterium]
MKHVSLSLPLLLAMPAMAQMNPVQLELRPWATGLSGPVYATHAGDGRLFVVERAGRIRIVTDSMQVQPGYFLNITDRVNDGGGEQGLLGLAFDPEYAQNGFFYVNYIHGSGNGTSRISRFQVTANPDSADPASETVLYTLPQPYSNHNGGCLQFGPDGYLYCGFGDGGSGNDPENRAQNLGNALGDMIRIDVSQHNSTYAIPPDNPFVSAQDTLPEIWASGLRNPWRFSFDRLTGDLWIGDVGQNAWEEVDHWPATNGGGANFGWRCREGFVPTPNVSQSGCAAQGPFVDPVAVFNHGTQGWCSVIGGYVYRGTEFPRLQGLYIFTDYCNGDFLSLGADHALDTLLMTGNYGYSGFGEDVAGELYITDVEHGTLHKVADACPMPDPVINFDGETLSCDGGNGWQWFLDGEPIPGANAQDLAPVANGTYQVRTNLGDCQLWSNELVVTNLGITEQGAFRPKVYPQPARDRLEVRHDGPKPRFHVDVLDASGRGVLRLEWPRAAAVLAIDASGLPAGAYVLRGTSADGVGWNLPVVVEH